MEKIKAILRNKWFGFIFWSLLYILWFVIWTGNLWLLLGELVIVDLYFTHFLSRLIGRRNREWCRRSPTYKFIYEWVNAIVFATVVASLIHIFVFQMYVIPSSSMESSLLIGDYLYVSKVAYGPQMPNTPVSFPFVHHTMPFSQTKKSFSECIRWPYHRLKGLRKHRAQRRGGLQLPRRRHGAAPAAGRHLLRRACANTSARWAPGRAARNCSATTRSSPVRSTSARTTSNAAWPSPATRSKSWAAKSTSTTSRRLPSRASSTCIR